MATGENRNCSTMNVFVSAFFAAFGTVICARQAQDTTKQRSDGSKSVLFVNGTISVNSVIL
eukprot:m.235803 g.235803  ORF g.235803 m.235803 type:complete len:61 (+) comp13918_c0_seq32:194-376(+)